MKVLNIMEGNTIDIYKALDYYNYEEKKLITIYCPEGKLLTRVPKIPSDLYKRNLITYQEVAHFKDTQFLILGLLVLDNELYMIYQSIDEVKVFIQPLELFMSKVDKNKYPEEINEYVFMAEPGSSINIIYSIDTDMPFVSDNNHFSNIIISNYSNIKSVPAIYEDMYFNQTVYYDLKLTSLIDAKGKQIECVIPAFTVSSSKHGLKNNFLYNKDIIATILSDRNINELIMISKRIKYKDVVDKYFDYGNNKFRFIGLAFICDDIISDSIGVIVYNKLKNRNEIYYNDTTKNKIFDKLEALSMKDKL